MDPQIQYAKTSDGVGIAYWTLGEGGTPLVTLSPLLFGHLARELEVPDLRTWYERLAAKRLLVRVDVRNQGLSQRGVQREPGDHPVCDDILAVVQRLGLERVSLLGFYGPAQGLVAFAARHSERVSRLALWASQATNPPHSRFEALVDLAEKDWDTFVETFAHTYLGWSRGRLSHWWSTFIRDSTNQEDFVATMRTRRPEGVKDLLPLVEAPTLVLYQPRLLEGDAQQQSQLLASGIPNARLVQLDESFVVPFLNEAGTGALEAFLEEDEPAEAAIPSGTAIILFADIASSTALTERLGDAAFREKARELDGALRAAISANDGTAIEGKLLGDGVLATFGAAREAIACARACHSAAGEVDLALHVGIHAGDVIREEGNVFGGAVNIAARVASEAAAGETLVSATVRDLARTSAGVDFEDRGERALKGVAEPVRLFAVRTA